jgi:hypothetical protein
MGANKGIYTRETRAEIVRLLPVIYEFLITRYNKKASDKEL